MKQYLLDTNICIYLLKDLFGLVEKIEAIGINNFFISEITIAELKFGAENSAFPEKNAQKISQIQQIFTVIPIFSSLDVYAKEKARLKKEGRILDDFDLLIGATAIHNNLTLITRNVSDFERLKAIEIEQINMNESRPGKRSGKAQSNVLPAHVLKSIEKGTNQYLSGQTISLDEFKERHFLKGNLSGSPFL